jgi:osmotically-inducible protein OsmY
VLTSTDEVQIDVDDGVVSLQGAVDSYFDRRHYEDVVASVVSVKSIVNELEVDAIAEGYYPPYLYEWNPITSPVYEHGVGAEGMTDPELLEQIEDALYWSPYVNEDRVTVAVKGGIATLSGNVPTRYAARVAVEKAYREGAVSVIDNLTVNVYPS